MAVWYHHPIHSALDAMQMDQLIAQVRSEPEMYLDKIQEWIAINLDVGVSVSAIHEIIRDAGFTYKYLHKAAVERDEEYRMRWMEDVKSHFTAAQMVFVDESSKDECTIYHHCGRAPSGERASTDVAFVRFSLVAALSLDGYIATWVVKGSVDGPEFFSFIAEDVVCSNSLCCTTINLMSSP